MKSALITGITGQDGSYLAELLLQKGYSVHGLMRRASVFTTERLEHLYEPPERTHRRFRLHHGDLLDLASIREAMLKANPCEVYHLGAQSHVAVSFDVPVSTVEIGTIGTLNILEAARWWRDKGNEVRFYNAASSEMFGDVLETPQTELTPFNPRSPYGCAKAYAYYQTKNYREAYDLFSCNGILFNHESPRRGETFVTRKITRAATRIKLHLQDELLLGNLSAKRDWGFAGDYVKAMWSMLQQNEPGDYVISTGTTISVREFADYVFDLLDLDPKRHIRQDARCMRPSDVEALCGDSSKALKKLRWTATTRWQALARMMVDADMELAAQERLLADNGFKGATVRQNKGV